MACYLDRWITLLIPKGNSVKTVVQQEQIKDMTVKNRMRTINKMYKIK